MSAKASFWHLELRWFTEKKSGAKVAPQWNYLEKWFHFVKVESFFP